MPSETLQILREGLQAWSIVLTGEQSRRFETYAAMLADWNERRMNLTRLTEPRQIAVLHFLDSLAIFRVIDLPQSSRILDIGTGAGFPGLAMKILRPDLRVTLLEATAKKLTFCRAVIEALGLTDIETRHGRAEEMARWPGQTGYDLVTARAVARLATLLGWAVPLVRPGGLFVAWKGPRAQEEMADAAEAARQLAVTMRRVELTLPQTGPPPATHSYVVCRRRP